MSHRTQVPAISSETLPTGLSPSTVRVSTTFGCFIRMMYMLVLQPHKSKLLWFGLIPVRSPLLRESLLFSIPLGTKMFQFPRLPRHTYVFSMP